MQPAKGVIAGHRAHQTAREAATAPLMRAASRSGSRQSAASICNGDVRTALLFRPTLSSLRPLGSLAPTQSLEGRRGAGLL
jgi:hypothetical protein